MKQTLTLALLGAVYATAALFDAPLVLNYAPMCAAGLPPYEGMGWFAGCSAALATPMLVVAFIRAAFAVPATLPFRYGIESVAMRPDYEPGLVTPLAVPALPAPEPTHFVPPVDPGPG